MDRGSKSSNGDFIAIDGEPDQPDDVIGTSRLWHDDEADGEKDDEFCSAIFSLKWADLAWLPD